MKSKLSQILFSFISGASLAQVGDLPEDPFNQTSHVMLLDKSPEVSAQKLSTAQLKDVLDLKLSGVDAYMVTVKNPSRRSYSLTAASIDAPIISYGKSQKIMEKKANIWVSIGFSVAGHFAWPVSVVGNIFKFAMQKKAKIFEGKLKAMLLDKEVVGSYSQLSRIVLVNSQVDLSKKNIELIDMQTMQVKKITIS